MTQAEVQLQENANSAAHSEAPAMKNWREYALLFAMGFVSVWVIGGISGVMTAAVPFDIHVHDTYFIVAHIHYVLFGGSISTI